RSPGAPRTRRPSPGCPAHRAVTLNVRELSAAERLVLANAGANARLEGQELPEEDEELATAYLAGEIDAATYQRRIRELVTGSAAAGARTAERGERPGCRPTLTSIPAPA